MTGKRARHRTSGSSSRVMMGGFGGVNPPRNGGEICMALVVVAAAAACATSAVAAAAGSSTSPAFCSVVPQSTPTFVRKSMVNRFEAAVAVGISPMPVAFSSNKQISAATSTARSHMPPLFSSSDGTDVNFDESEWRAVTAALQMYKAAYGDLKVPSRFVVPSLPPWPEPAWSMKLGQRVASIRSTGKYVQDNDTRRQQLEDMGFLWRLRAPSRDSAMNGITFDQVFEALQMYKEQIQPEGKINVPSNFVVPNADPWPESTRGMPLGKKIPVIRSKTYLKANPGAADRLAKLGFEFDGKAAANDQRYQKVYDALKRYKELNGDLFVPQPYVVPDGDNGWPENLWGLRLGARVNAIRSQGTFVRTNPDRKVELDELGFEWDPPADGKKRGRKKKEENEVLQGPAPPGILEGGLQGSAGAESGTEPYGDALFPFPDQKNKPLVWGFEDDDEEEAQQTAMDEFRVERDLNTTLETAIAVAKSVGIVRGVDEENRILKGKREKPFAWYIDDYGDDFVFEDVVEALSVYKDMHDSYDGLDDEAFVVPDQSEALFGAGTAAAFDAESSAAAAAAIAAAERGEGGDSDALIAAEIERLEASLSEEDEEGDDDDDEEVDDEDTSSLVDPDVKWPEHLAGMRLGNIVKRIRDGSLEVKHIRERRRKLDAISFDWGDTRKFLDVPFEKAMCAMLAYFQVRGDMMVEEDFIIPGEIPWPDALAGYELGKTVTRIRQLQNFFEAYHTDKVALLKMVDFYWFPDLAIPLDPFSWGETTEDEFLAAVGSPFYWIGEDEEDEEENFKPSMLENIMADGPTDNPDPNFRWYNYEHVREYWEGGPLGTELIKDIDSRYGIHLPAEILFQAGLPKLAREQEARFASGKLGEIARERLDLETDEDNLLRPILKSMTDIQALKKEYDAFSALLEAGDIDADTFELKTAPIEWKVEDIISRLRKNTDGYEGGARGQGERVRERREAFMAKEVDYEKELEVTRKEVDEEMAAFEASDDDELLDGADFEWEEAEVEEEELLSFAGEDDME